MTSKTRLNKALRHLRTVNDLLVEEARVSAVDAMGRHHIVLIQIKQLEALRDLIIRTPGVGQWLTK